MHVSPPGWPQFRKTAYPLAGLYLVLYAAWLLLGAGSPAERAVIDGLAAFFPAATAASLAWAPGFFRATALQRRTGIWVGGGIALWAASDLFLLASGAGQTGAPWTLPISHFAKLAGYLLVLVGIVLTPRRVRSEASRLRLLFDMTISSAALLVLGWEVSIRPLINLAGNADLFGAAAVPLADLLLLVVLVNIFLLTRPGQDATTLLWLSTGFIGFSFSDLPLAYQTLNNQAHTGSLNNLGWVAGYCAFYLGVLHFPRSGEQERSLQAQGNGNGRRQFISRLGLILEQGLQTLLPLIGTAALGAFSLVDWSIRGQVDPIGMWMTVLLGLVLVARQGVVTGEHEQQRYTVLVDSIAEPAFICDRKGRLKLANPALLQTLGYPQDGSALHNRPVLDLFAPANLDAPPSAGVEAAAPGGSPADLLETALRDGWSGEISLCRVDGATFPAYLSLRPIHRTGGDGLALAGTAHDLTLQKNQQAALQAAYEQIAMAHHQLETLNELLEQKVEDKTRSLSMAYQILEQQNRTLQKLDEIKSDFVSMVSHELRAPLTNISGGIELVLGQPQPLPGSAARSLALVQTEIRRLTHFVETILDLSTLDADRMPFYPGPLPLADLILVLRRQFEPAPGSERIEWLVPEGLPFVLADEHALTSVFFHLIDNALKYAPQGSITVQMAAVETKRVMVQVIDRGPGIPDDVLPLLFEKFYRAHRGDAQTVYGHGLGLYIVRRLLGVMDSDIRVENRPEGGACFTFWLKVIEENDEHEAAAG